MQTQGQLEEFIKTPTVLVTSNDEPYEFKEKGSSTRFRCRRQLTGEIPFELYQMIIEEGVSLVQLLEFSSGVFLNYVDQKSIYL